MTKPAEPALFSLADLADRFGGVVHGDASVRITQVSPLETAQPGQLSFLTNNRYLRQLAATRASAVILGEELKEATQLPRIVCRNPYAYFARVSTLLNPAAAFEPGIAPGATVSGSARVAASAHVGAGAVIADGAVVGERVRIGPGCYVGNGVQIGDDTLLHANVTVYHDCVIGARVIVHSGAVIGADGFGMAMDEGAWIKIPQVGRVLVGDDCEVGANTTIDRGALEDTVLEEDVKLDNQIQIGHNCRIGAHTAIAGSEVHPQARGLHIRFPGQPSRGVAQECVLAPPPAGHEGEASRARRKTEG
jgi:UDP-3-O-[3-hydroxymyristoyl] glucosamine N-acyltransferase